MKYKILEAWLPFQTGILEFEDGYLVTLFSKRDGEHARKKVGKDFKGFGVKGR